MWLKKELAPVIKDQQWLNVANGMANIVAAYPGFILTAQSNQQLRSLCRNNKNTRRMISDFVGAAITYEQKKAAAMLERCVALINAQHTVKTLLTCALLCLYALLQVPYQTPDNAF